VRYFVQKFSRRLNKVVEYVPTEAMAALANYSWPGNVRELENFVERAVLLSPGKELRVQVSELLSEPGSPATVGLAHRAVSSSVAENGNGASASASISTLEQAEREHILRALQQTQWRIGGPKGAAAVLDMKRTTLQARMRKLNIRRPV
jgi:formate hydrogenlyase transcriptional activator